MLCFCDYEPCSQLIWTAMMSHHDRSGHAMGAGKSFGASLRMGSSALFRAGICAPLGVRPIRELRFHRGDCCPTAPPAPGLTYIATRRYSDCSKPPCNCHRFTVYQAKPTTVSWDYCL